MALKVNLADTKTFEPPSEGRYPGVIVSAEEGKTGKDDTKVDVRWEVEEEGVTKTVWDNCPIEGAGAWKTERMLIGTGLCANRDEVQGFEFDEDDLVGLQALLTIKHEVQGEDAPNPGEIRGTISRIARLKGPSATGGGIFGRGK